MCKQVELAILMADLSGFTAMTEMHGPQSAIDTVNRYLELAGKSMYGSSRLLERVGDQLVIVSPDSSDIAITALRLMEYASLEKNFLPVHAGLHFGSIIEDAGSFFGSALNIKYRIAEKAKNGSILCSKEFVESTGSSDLFYFKKNGQMKLKNILHPVSLLELLPVRKNQLTNTIIDPVCLMQVDESSAYTYSYEGSENSFCSEECLELFKKDPALILSRE